MMVNYDVVETHVSEIKHGDTIVENGELITVSGNHIKHDKFMGATIRGNSYCNGRHPVMKAVIKRMVGGVWVSAQ